jgi:FtsP/CotA-like multicopper oxidase with cupredoxin domain
MERRNFLKTAAMAAGAVLLPDNSFGTAQESQSANAADYTLHIRTSPVEIAKNRIVSLTTYNGQFPGPLLRLKEGQPVTVDVQNDTDVPEQLHWHGQMVPVEVDAPRKKVHLLFPRGASGASFLRPNPQDFAFITRTFAPEPTSTPANMAGRLARCTSSQNMSRDAMTARSF